jgi:hypothetical protein
MNSIKTIGRKHSLNGKENKITVLEKCGNNDYIVEYKGVKYHAIFNVFVNRYYVDDIYGRVKNK